MSGAWTCVTEEAVRSDSSDFVAGETACTTLAQSVDDAASALSADAGNGWEGVEGDYATGLQSVAQIAAQQVGDFGSRAVELAQHHGRAAGALEVLEADSRTLLRAAEAVHIRYVTAAEGEANSWLAANAHIRTMSASDPDSAAWFYADRAFRQCVESAREYATQRLAAEEELNELQTQFDELRELEDKGDQEFADLLSSVDLTAPPIEIDAAGVSAASVDLVFDALDAAAVALPLRSHSVTGRQRSSAVYSARHLLAAVAGTDLAVRDERVDTVQFTQRLRRSTPEEFARQFLIAVQDGDIRSARRQSELLLRGIGAMNQTEAEDYLNMLMVRDLVVVMALHEVPAHPAIIGTLMAMGEGTTYPFLTTAQGTMLIEVFGDDRDAGFGTLVGAKAYEDILAQGIGYERLNAGLAGAFGPVSRHTSPDLGAALRTHLVANPQLVNDLATGDPRHLGRMLNIIDVSNPSEAEWNEIVGVYISNRPFADLLAADSQADNWAVWSTFGSRVGHLRRQIDEVGGDESYSYHGIVSFAMKTGLGEIPVAGSVLKATYDGLDKLISGHAANTLEDRVDAEAEADLARKVLAMGILAQADPEAANEVLSVLEGVEPGKEAEAVDRFMAGESDLSYQVAGIAEQIERGESTALNED